MKRILLISPERNYPLSNEMYPSGALLSLGTVLKTNGYEVKVIHQVTDKVTLKDLSKLIITYFPNIVGITETTFQTKFTRRIVAIVKSYCPQCKVVVGGPHPSAVREEIFEELPGLDIAVIGEGEEAILGIAKGSPIEGIPNIIYKEEFKIGSNPQEVLEDLDNLPYQDLELVNYKRYTGAYPLGKRPSTFLMGSRGCPFSCVFCSKSVYGSKVRLRDPKELVGEIEYLYLGYGIREIFFQDDTFNVNLGWAHEVLDNLLYSKVHKKVAFRTPFRVNENLVNYGLLNRMKEAGFWLIFYGVESGDQNMLDWMRKGTTIEEIKRAFKLTHEAGIKTEASFIMGLPGETVKSLESSIKLWKDIKPYWTGFSRATPFPGTELYNLTKDRLEVSSWDEYKPDMFYYPQNPGVEELSNKIDNLMKREKLKRLAVKPWEAIRYI